MTEYFNKIRELTKNISPLLVDFSVPRDKARTPTQASSNFITNKEQGDWAENLLTRAINESFKGYVAVKYGKSDSLVAGEDGFDNFYQSFQEELDTIGKRPDLLIFKKEDFDKSLVGSNQPSDITTQKRGGLKQKFAPEKLINFHPDNERIKHRYFDKVIHRFGKNGKTLRKVISAIYVFEEFSGFKDFKLFKYEDAKDFQKYLLQRYSHSIQTAYRTMQALQEFFLWLKEQNGYKKLQYDDIKSLRLSLKDTEKAKASKPRKTIDLEKWEEMVLNIQPKDELELRGRAMFSCLLLTGVRIDALISLRIPLT